jgi:lysophospholipase L1-like esterase
MMMMRPKNILLFVLEVFLLLSVAIFFTPADGVKIGRFTFHMPTFNEMFTHKKVATVDISEIVESNFDIDSIAEPVLDTLKIKPAEKEIRKASYDSLVKHIHRIELNKNARKNLMWFFNKLKLDSTARIMHYGDSQIEGDRITGYIRNKLQKKFGGTGPGLRPAVQPYDYIFSAVQTNSPNFKRCPIYGKVDTLVKHRRYGVMGAFARFAPPVCDTIPFRDSVLYDSELSISKSRISYNRTKIYKRLRLFYGNAKRPVKFQLIVKDDTILTKILQQNLNYGMISCKLPTATDKVTLHFSGYDSPDIYGIELGDPKGITVDNIALRGSSGTIFTKSDFAHTTKMYNDLKPNLFILQFGGNVMPYIKNQKAADRYGRWFKSQINRLKRECPNAAIVVIGPSDMSTKEKDKYVTYEYLPTVVDALRNAALTSGCGYWDMYKAMGGQNSMPSWVNAEPELARPDYTHFSARGARLIANMFYNALILEYNNYLRETKGGKR